MVLGDINAISSYSYCPLLIDFIPPFLAIQAKMSDQCSFVICLSVLLQFFIEEKVHTKTTTKKSKKDFFDLDVWEKACPPKWDGWAHCTKPLYLLFLFLTVNVALSSPPSVESRNVGEGDFSQSVGFSHSVRLWCAPLRSLWELLPAYT